MGRQFRELARPYDEIWGKRNGVLIDPQGRLGPVFLKSWRGENNVRALERDYRALCLLDGSGVTPKPYELIVGPGYEANLFREYIEGSSLDKLGPPSPDHLKHFNEIFASAFGALNTVHKHGVLLVDVDSSELVLTPDLRIFIIDFDQSIELETYRKLRLTANDPLNWGWYSQVDVGLKVILRWWDICRYFGDNSEISTKLRTLWEHFSFDEETAIKTEQHSLALMMVNFFIPDINDKIVNPNDLNSGDKKKYQKEYALFRPMIEWMVEIHCLDPDQLESTTNRAMINITFPYLLEKGGIKADEWVSTFLKRALSPYFEERL